ncbi:MAG: MBL fold metallo-hydrolase [Planctomycetia bacterium]|nr:MBL fold metallo-hydrolase [Planctomycetia bacterium]
MDLAITELVVSPFQQNCRVVVDRASGDAVVVDPGDDPKRILAAVKQSGGNVRYLLATHGHLDHVGAVVPVRAALKVPFAIHRGDRPILDLMPDHAQMFGMGPLKVPDIDLDLAEVDELPFGAGLLRVLKTPGHTPGGCTFLFHDPSHGGTDIGLFGDSLFHLSVGRTDLGGDARVYACTIRDVLLALPDETVVHSGHGPSSTIAVERAMNPFLNGDVSLDAPGGW